MARPLERLLNLQPGDTTRGFLLFSYLFLIMASYMAARIARDAIFLNNFLAVDLAYVDLASALLIGFVVVAYLSIGRHVSLPKLLAGSLLFYASNLLVFWYIAEVHEPRWLSPVIYVWVSVYGALAPVQVWTLANYVLTTREAKRVFGLVGSGAIVGAVVGAKLSSLLAKRFSAESLLLAVAVAMLMCVALVPLIWRTRDAILGPDSEARRTAEEAPQARIVESLRLIAQAPYLRSIAFLILVANFTTSLAGWQFKALAKFFIPQKDALAAFFGDFYFYAGIAGFVVQLLVTGRLLRRFGLGPALLVVPVALVLGSTGVLFWGSVTIWAAIALRSCINVLQYSVDKPSVELLYLPVPADIKNQVKSFIDTVVWRFGDGLAAVAVLAFGKGLGWKATQVSWVVLVLITGWVTAAFIARRFYVDTLRASIHEHRLDAERTSAAVLDRSTTEMLADRLHAPDPKEILYALSLFQMGRERAAHPAIRGLLDHPAADVRQRAISILSDAQDTRVIPQIEKLLKDPDLGVRTEALLYLARHAHVDPLTRIEELGDFADFSIRSAVVAFLARPGKAQNVEVARIMLEAMVREAGPEGKRARLEAARLLAHLPDYFEQQHEQLLADEDPDVVLAALRAVAQHPKPRFVARLLEFVKHPDLAADAAEALSHYGDVLVPTLRDHLTNPAVPIEARREIPAVLARLGTPAAAQALNEAVLESDTQLRFRTISALNKIYQSHPELERDRQMIETVLAAEIMGHYRSYQIMGTLGDNINEEDPVVKGLREAMGHEVERIFRLLALLYPKYDLHSAYYGVQSDSPVVHDNALEFLDNVLEPQLRKVLVPLVDSTVKIADRMKLANQVVGASVESTEQAVAALVQSDDPWLKSCGAYAVGTLGLRALEPELDRCLNHPDPLLRETARQAKQRLAAIVQPARP
jgi:AAA family ATP:ADP antiporter